MLQEKADWTKADDIALIEAYLGYEVQACGDVTVCVDGNGKTLHVPDMRTPAGWALDCLDSWLSVQEHRHVKLHQHSTSRRRFVWLFEPGMEDVPIGEGRNLHESVARALRAAVGK